LPSFGAKLKQEREKRKMTLEEISVSTKIGTRMLQALEEDKFNVLPGGIFNKGFVRAYSRVVGLDEEQTVAEYMQASGDAPPPRTETVSPDDRARVDTGREHQENVNRLEASAGASPRQLPWGLFAAGLLLVALVLSLWSHRRREQVSLPAPVSASETASSVGMPSGAGDTSGASSPTASSAQPSPASTQPGVLPAPRRTSVSSGSPASSAGQKSQDQRSQDAVIAPALNPGEFSVAIHAREDSWISINADGKTSSELLAAGSDRAIRARKEIIARVGNAGGVDLRFNGKKIDTGGQFGDVETLTFGPRGLLPPMPSTPSTH
jgi:cytoskeleton protein RodZ